MKFLSPQKVTIYIILFLFSFGIFFISYAQEKTTQETHGNQSPVVYTENGDIEINYEMAEGVLEVFKKTVETLEAYIKLKDREKNLEVKNLEQRLINIHKNEFDSLPEEAERWATNFLATMPIRLDRLLEQERLLDKSRTDKRLESAKCQKKVEIYFEYLFDTIDSKLNALRMIDDKIKVQKTDNSLPIFSDSSSSSTIRKIIFENGSLINIDFSQGKLEKGLIKKGPVLCFMAHKRLFCVKEQVRGITIVAAGGHFQDVEEPDISDITYSYNLNNETIISEQLKNDFLRSFDEALGRVYYKDKSISLKKVE